MLSHRIIPGAIVGAFWCAMILCSVVSSWNAFERFEQRHPVPGLPKGESPSRAGFYAQGRSLDGGAQGVSPDGAGDPAEGRLAPGRRVMRKASASRPPRVLYTVTAYSHTCAKPRDGRERAPRPAANGEWPIPGLTLAADWTLHPPGSVLIVGGQRWRVTDRGHDIRGRRLDLFLSTCAEARLYGRRVVAVQVQEGE